MDDPDFERLFAIQKESVSNWELTCESSIVNIYRKLTKESPIVMLKGYAKLEDIPVRVAFEVVYN